VNHVLETASSPDFFSSLLGTADGLVQSSESAKADSSRTLR
jgi:hypothetical protein